MLSGWLEKTQQIFLCHTFELICSQHVWAIINSILWVRATNLREAKCLPNHVLDFLITQRGITYHTNFWYWYRFLAFYGSCTPFSWGYFLNEYKILSLWMNLTLALRQLWLRKTCLNAEFTVAWSVIVSFIWSRSPKAAVCLCFRPHNLHIRSLISYGVPPSHSRS